VTPIRAGQGRRQAALLEFVEDLLLARRHALPKLFDVEPRCTHLREHAFGSLLVFVNVVLGHLYKHFHLGLEEAVGRAVADDLGDEHLGAVVLDVRLVQDVVFDPALTCGIEDFLLDDRVRQEFKARRFAPDGPLT